MSASPIWSLYIVENCYQQLYTGVTTNVERRFKEHQASGSKTAKALKGKGPLSLRYQQTVGEHALALRLERKVKSLSRAKKLALIAGEFTLNSLAE